MVTMLMTYGRDGEFKAEFRLVNGMLESRYVKADGTPTTYWQQRDIQDENRNICELIGSVLHSYEIAALNTSLRF